MIVSEHKVDERICDAIAASIVIHFDDGKRLVAQHLCIDEPNPLKEITKKFVPACL